MEIGDFIETRIIFKNNYSISTKFELTGYNDETKEERCQLFYKHTVRRPEADMEEVINVLKNQINELLIILGYVLKTKTLVFVDDKNGNRCLDEFKFNRFELKKA